MFEFHKLEDGDIIKILPLIKGDKISWIEKFDRVIVETGTGYRTSASSYLRGWKPLYDNGGYLNRINRKIINSVLSPSGLKISTIYIMNVYISGVIKMISMNRTLFDIIMNNKKLCDIKGNHHLIIVTKDVHVVGANGLVAKDFTSSYVDEVSWKSPVNDKNSKEEWYSYIKSNGPDFDSYFNEHNIFNNRNLLLDSLKKNN
jgi:hypothetical protein